MGQHSTICHDKLSCTVESGTIWACYTKICDAHELFCRLLNDMITVDGQQDLLAKLHKILNFWKWMVCLEQLG